MSFKEFICDATSGSNINAGDNTANGVVTSTNGGWSTSTHVFTAASGTPFSGVSVGDYVSIYTDGATVGVFCARVTVIGGGGATLTTSATDNFGTAPTTAGTGISATTGGMWKGPNGSSAFPLGLISSAAVATNGDLPRVSLRNNGGNYAITAAMTHNKNGVHFEGCTTAAGDGGQAQIDGGNPGTSIGLMTVSGQNNNFDKITFANNGAAASGTSAAITLSGLENSFHKCVLHDIMGNGIVATGNGNVAISCESYLCNKSNTAGVGGFNQNSGTLLCVNCVSHDHSASPGTNCHGFVNGNAAVPMVLVRCISCNNSGRGMMGTTNGVGSRLIDCDFYNNTGDHYAQAVGANVISTLIAINCNFTKGSAWAIDITSGQLAGYIINCGFGTGTQVNTSGDTHGINSTNVIGKVTYASNATPYNAPTTGDFTIVLAAAKSAGYGPFTETKSGFSGTTGTFDIGAAYAAQAAGGGGGAPIIGSPIVRGM